MCDVFHDFRRPRIDGIQRFLIRIILTWKFNFNYDDYFEFTRSMDVSIGTSGTLHNAWSVRVHWTDGAIKELVTKTKLNLDSESR